MLLLDRNDELDEDEALDWNFFTAAAGTILLRVEAVEAVSVDGRVVVGWGMGCLMAAVDASLDAAVVVGLGRVGAERVVVGFDLTVGAGLESFAMGAEEVVGLGTGLKAVDEGAETGFLATTGFAAVLIGLETTFLLSVAAFTVPDLAAPAWMRALAATEADGADLTGTGLPPCLAVAVVELATFLTAVGFLLLSLSDASTCFFVSPSFFSSLPGCPHLLWSFYKRSHFRNLLNLHTRRFWRSRSAPLRHRTRLDRRTRRHSASSDLGRRRRSYSHRRHLDRRLHYPLCGHAARLDARSGGLGVQVAFRGSRGSVFGVGVGVDPVARVVRGGVGGDRICRGRWLIW